MMLKVSRIFFAPFSVFISEKIGRFFARFLSKKLITQLEGAATDKFLELLLSGMDLALVIFKGYRENIRGFTARYAFSTADGQVNASALFAKNQMTVKFSEVGDWDVRIVFQSAEALRRFLFSKDQDILNSLLANEVEVHGNLNLVYKLGFMVRDLARIFGVK